jgi:hypothetical protein
MIVEKAELENHKSGNISNYSPQATSVLPD